MPILLRVLGIIPRNPPFKTARPLLVDSVITVGLNMTNPTTTMAVSRTITPAANSLLMATISVNTANLVDQTDAGDSNVTGVNFGAAPLTRLGFINGGAGIFNRVEIWYLINPTVSTAMVTATYVGPELGFSMATIMGVWSLQDVNQSTPFGPFVSNTGGIGNLDATIDVPSIGRKDLSIGIISARRFFDFTLGAKQIERYKVEFIGSDGAENKSAGSTEPGRAPTVKINWTNAPGDASDAEWAIAGASIKLA